MIWNKLLSDKFAEIGASMLRPSALERDRSAQFSAAAWQALAEHGLFALGRSSRRLELRDLASAYYGLAYGSWDLPFSCSAAAHGVIGRDLLLKFGTEPQLMKFLESLEQGKSRFAIANAEAGAAEDMRKIRASCRKGENGAWHLVASKPCVTNGHQASTVFVSAWRIENGKEPSIEIYLVDGNEAKTGNLADELSGFRTGITGSVSIDADGFPADERKLSGKAFSIFRQCFHMERLFIAVMVCGLLQALEDEAKKILMLKSSPAGYEKLVRIACARVGLTALTEKILAGATETALENFGAELSVTKLMIQNEVQDAAQAFLEISGHRGIKADHFAQKILRDVSALHFFGGNAELQKSALVGELMTRVEAAAIPKKQAG